MKAIRFALGSLLFLALLGHVAQAQLQRTFVSGLGTDGNPCTRTAPCRTFAQAISQTNAGGEVVALDSAGYGPFTITRSVTVEAPPGVYAGISVVSGDGIDINAGGSDTVILRGLTVTNQAGPANTNGVVLNSGAKLHVEGCVIDGFSNLDGLHVMAGALVEVIDSILRGNGTGIGMQTSSGTVQAIIDHVRLEANNTGLLATDNCDVIMTNSIATANFRGVLAQPFASGSVQMDVENSVLSGNLSDGIDGVATMGTVLINVTRCQISGNHGDGILAQSFSTPVARVRLSDSTVTHNTIGLENSGSPAIILSRGNNTVEGNSIDSLGTIGSYTAK